jgi:hypothetical protein
MRAAVMVLVTALAMSGCSEVAFIERITIVNGTEYSANVDVTSAGRDGWLGLGVIEATESRSFDEVVDQGRTWVFRFDYAAKHDEEIEITRQELEEANWRIEVPASFGEALRDLGVEPPP